MNNPEDAALMTSEGGRQKYADAVTHGIAAYLSAQPR
jgi:N-acetylmuramoyl-L-alanine amidase